jgi:hypothetical protein
VNLEADKVVEERHKIALDTEGRPRLAIVSSRKSNNVAVSI